MFHIYSAVRNDFSRQAGKNIFAVAREERTGFTRNRSVRVCILGVAGSRSQHLQPSLPYRPPGRCWRTTSWSGRPRKTSEGRYRRNSPQRGHSTVMDWKGNSLTPVGTSRRHFLHVTTNALRPVGVGNLEPIRRRNAPPEAGEETGVIPAANPLEKCAENRSVTPVALVRT
jgi:hypothetical protein